MYSKFIERMKARGSTKSESSDNRHSRSDDINSTIKQVFFWLLSTPLLTYYIYILGSAYLEGEIDFFGDFSDFFSYSTEGVFNGAFLLFRDIIFSILSKENLDNFVLILVIFSSVVGVVCYLRRTGELDYLRMKLSTWSSKFPGWVRKGGDFLYSAGVGSFIYSMGLFLLLFVVLIFLLPQGALDLGKKRSERIIVDFEGCEGYKNAVKSKIVAKSGSGAKKSNLACTCLYSDEGDLVLSGYLVKGSREYLLIYKDKKGGTTLVPNKHLLIHSPLDSGKCESITKIVREEPNSIKG